MTRDAFIISVSAGFAMGAFALIESMKEYGHTEDLHILLWTDCYTSKHNHLVKKLEEAEAPFNIHLVPISDLIRKYDPKGPGVVRDKGWCCRFCAYPYMLDQAYLSYCIWQGDLLLLNNIRHYLDVAQLHPVLSQAVKWPKLVSGGEGRIGKRLVKDLENLICNIPFITSNRELLEMVWVEGCERGRSDMMAIYNAAIRTCGFDHLFLVPYGHWVYDFYFQKPLLKQGKYYYKMDGSKLNSYHGPFYEGWGFDRRRFGEVGIQNHRLFNQRYFEVAQKYELVGSSIKVRHPSLPGWPEGPKGGGL